MVGEERYGRVVRYWETYDFIGKEDTKVDEWTRLNIATSYWKIGQPEKAIELLKPFLQKKQVKDVSDKALGLAVNIYLDQLAWKEISDLIAMAKKNWTLKPEQLRQLDYARAMSLQNLGNSNQALPMWAELAKDVKVEPAFRAYAMYYMAKAAMERQDLRKVFVYAQEALSLLLQTNGDPEKIKDAVLMSIYATERSGRYNEASSGLVNTTGILMLIIRNGPQPVSSSPVFIARPEPLVNGSSFWGTSLRRSRIRFRRNSPSPHWIHTILNSRQSSTLPHRSRESTSEISRTCCMALA